MQGSLTSSAGKTHHALRRVARLLACGVAALVLAASREPVLGAGSESGAGAWALVWVDGRPVPGDQGAYMVNGTLMLPARVLEQAGATLRWDARTKTATLARDGHQARATVGQPWLAAGGKRVLMPQPPELVDGQLMVPIRAVAQALGITVRWDGKTGRVALETAPVARIAAAGAGASGAAKKQAAPPPAKPVPASQPAPSSRPSPRVASPAQAPATAPPMAKGSPAPSPGRYEPPPPPAPPPLPGATEDRVKAAVALATPSGQAVKAAPPGTAGPQPPTRAGAAVAAATPAPSAPDTEEPSQMRRPGGAASEGAPAEPGEVTGVLVRRDGGRTRVEVLSHGPVKLESAPTVLRDPPRLVLDIANARLTAPTSEYPASGALVKGVRLGQPSPGVVRVAVDLTAAVGFELTKDPEDGHVSVTLHYAVTGVHWLRDAAGRGQVWLEMSGLAPVKTSVLSDPLRLAVDLQKATLVAPAGEWEVSQGPVRRYRVSQYQPDVVRVVMELAQPVQPRVITSLDLTRQLLASQAAAPLPAGGETAPGSAEPGGPGGAPPTVDLVLDVYSRITQIAVRPLGSGGASVTVHATGPVEPRAFYLRRPDRLVLDIPGAIVDPSLRTGTGAIQVPKDGSLARAVRVGQFLPRSARVVVELERPVGFQVFSADERETAIIALGNQPLQGRVVAIDPGHGGFDPGAIGASGTPEKVYNLDIGRRVGKLLESVGVEVALTRRDDTFVGLDDRVELAKKLKAEVFVSIHHNASTSTLGSGTEVFYSPNHPASQRLAELLYDALLDKLHQAGRGLEMRGDLRVLRLAPMPAALVEVAFVDNAQEERRLMDPGFRQQAADAIFSAIVSFLSQTGHDTVGKVNAQMLAAEGRQAH